MKWESRFLPRKDKFYEILVLSYVNQNCNYTDDSKLGDMSNVNGEAHPDTFQYSSIKL